MGPKHHSITFPDLYPSRRTFIFLLSLSYFGQGFGIWVQNRTSVDNLNTTTIESHPVGRLASPPQRNLNQSSNRQGRLSGNPSLSWSSLPTLGQWPRLIRSLPVVSGGIFTLISFQNVPCNATTGDIGLCYSVRECQKLGGTASGGCAGNYGVCCVGLWIRRRYMKILMDLRGNSNKGFEISDGDLRIERDTQQYLLCESILSFYGHGTFGLLHHGH